MQSSRQKWIPLYKHVSFIDGRSHTSFWYRTIFNENNDKSIDMLEFTKRLLINEVQASVLGHGLSSSQLNDTTDDKLQVAVELWWNKLVPEQHQNDLKSEQFEKQMKLLCGQQHAATYIDFCEIFRT